MLDNSLEGLRVPPGTQGVQGQRISKEDADRYLKDHLVSIQAIEQQIGLDLLPWLDAAEVKRAVASELWPRN